MGKKEIRVLHVRTTIYSDGRVETLDNTMSVIDELSGKLDVIHDIVMLLNNNRLNKGHKDRFDVPKQLEFKNVDLYFQASGTDDYIEVREEHLERLAKYIVGGVSIDEINNVIENLE